MISNSVESRINQESVFMPTVRELKKGRRSLVRGRVIYYLRCERCGTEFNVSPRQVVENGIYICPDCDGGEEEAWDG